MKHYPIYISLTRLATRGCNNITPWVGVKAPSIIGVIFSSPFFLSVRFLEVYLLDRVCSPVYQVVRNGNRLATWPEENRHQFVCLQWPSVRNVPVFFFSSPTTTNWNVWPTICLLSIVHPICIPDTVTFSDKSRAGKVYCPICARDRLHFFYHYNSSFYFLFFSYT